jgi:hypothetical protein
MDDPRRQREDQYFLGKDRDLLDKLREDARKQAQREQLAQAAGVDAGHAVLEDLEKLGFTAPTMRVLHLAPLVAIAWADGVIQPSERELIWEAARAHGVQPDTEASQKLEKWLAARPSEEALAKAATIIRALIDARPENEREQSRTSLLGLCSEVAAVAGGVLGIGKVSPAEQRTLARIVGELEKSHERAARQVADSI